MFFFFFFATIASFTKYVTKIYENFSLHKMNVRIIRWHLSSLDFDRLTFSVLRSSMLSTLVFEIRFTSSEDTPFFQKRNNLHEISFHCICDLDNFTMIQCDQRCTDWVYIVFSGGQNFLGSRCVSNSYGLFN